jgi:hypothetical protein
MMVIGCCMAESQQLKIKFSSLIQELKTAKLYFSFYQKLVEAKKGRDLLDSYGFWDHTITSYAISTFACLCRVYDNYPEKPEAFHLSKFVKDVKKINKDKWAEKWKDKTERAKLHTDLTFLSSGQKVLKLREWRNNVICHRNQELLLGGKDSFFKKNGFDEKEIKELIESGFLILKNWANIYESDFDKWIIEIHRANAQEEEDIPLVLAALRLFREK